MHVKERRSEVRILSVTNLNIFSVCFILLNMIILHFNIHTYIHTYIRTCTYVLSTCDVDLFNAVIDYFLFNNLIMRKLILKQ